jgi:predicted RNase H-like HicB family nuclease
LSKDISKYPAANCRRKKVNATIQLDIDKLTASSWRILMQLQLTTVYQQVPEGYIAFVEDLPGANTQGETLKETRSNLLEAVEMVLDANRVLAEESLQGINVLREPLLVTSP